MNFSLGELNSYEVHDFWHKSAINKISKLGPQYAIGNFLKHKYQK
jgi:hypothetical protein